MNLPEPKPEQPTHGATPNATDSRLVIPTARPERLLRLPDVESAVGLRKSAIYDGIKKRTFPRPLKLGRKTVCWPESQIQEWIAARIKAGGQA
jgi:prophage regulatory protein